MRKHVNRLSTRVLDVLHSARSSLRPTDLAGVGLLSALTFFSGATPGEESSDLQLYWAQGGPVSLFRANLDGSGFDRVFADEFEVGRGLTYAPSIGKLFWPDGRFDQIVANNVDGSEMQSVLCMDFGGNHPGEMAVDDIAGTLYWTDSGGDGLWRVNYDGSDYEEVIVEGLSGIDGFAIDSAGQTVYWVKSRSVHRANLDGSGHEVIINGQLPDWAHAIALDCADDKMYFVCGNRIFRANLDGSQMEMVIDDDVRVDSGIAIDPVAGHLYWLDDDGSLIKRSRLDGSDVQVFAVGEFNSGSLAIDFEGRSLFFAGKQLFVRRFDLDGPASEFVVMVKGPISVAIHPTDEHICWTNLSAIMRSKLDGAEPVRFAIEPTLTDRKGLAIPSIRLQGR